MSCATGWTFFPHTEKCYQYFAGSRIYGNNARAACQNLAPYQSMENIIEDLASIPDNITNEFVRTLTGGRSAWIGGRLNASSHYLNSIVRGRGHVSWTNGYWTDGTAWIYSPWAPREPNSGSYLLWANGGWQDRGSNEGVVTGYVCQYHIEGK